MTAEAAPEPTDVHGTPVLFVPDQGPPLDDVIGLLGDAFGARADWVAVPAGRLAPSFFDLATREAGEVLQKFAQYGVGVAIIGDIEERMTASRALRAFVTESNRGRQTWFLPDAAAFRARLDPESRSAT
ncbi:hypothetical protein GCM10022221_74510 [Actinocorallia aurea]